MIDYIRQNWLSILSIILAILALVQADKNNKSAERLSTYMTELLAHSNRASAINYVGVRKLVRTVGDTSGISLHKDEVVFLKAPAYTEENAGKCQQIMLDSGIIKAQFIKSITMTSFLEKSFTEAMSQNQICRFSLDDKYKIEKYLDLNQKLMNLGIYTILSCDAYNV